MLIWPGFIPGVIAGSVSSFLQMFRPQRLGNDMFATKPFAKVD
jgi:hypothetical protein